ncbi:MAG: bile acid:sodium symporter family protein [Streptococcaceae bacterium]|jgi:predicted Na+-dependent transporter|nr:bile acid:sodium symporter family protein [Streptococcaceae bacterium]
MFIGEPIAPLQAYVPWVFSIITFIGSLKMDLSSFKKTFSEPKPFILVMLVLRFIMPIWGLIFGRLLFPNDIYIQTGLLLFAVLPVAINSMIWTMLYKGNVTLSLSTILFDTILSPIIMPLSFLILQGTSVEMDSFGMMRSLLQMIVIPSILGIIINHKTKGKFGDKWSPILSPYTRIGMIASIIVNGATIRDQFPPFSLHLLMIMVSISFLSASGYTITMLIAKLFKLQNKEAKTIVFSGGMRNMGTGLVIAISHFPSQAAIPIITGMMLQQIVCSVFAKLMEKQFPIVEEKTKKKMGDDKLPIQKRLETS